MARIAARIVMVVALCAGAGCATASRQPVMSEAEILPPDLKPQESAIITVKLKDKYGIVKRVEGIVREDTRIKLKLHDDGEDPDVKAGDGIWSLKVDVPFHAAPGEFNLDIAAYNSKGDPVVVRTKQGDVAPLAATCKVAIQAATQ
ncbi:MAG: hypothetical protein HZB26_01860 [Candidatus Hydrogenedentes bacterium]|nr:hypothetical protein [Candidatus Hydrogenedentota bacterium]